MRSLKLHELKMVLRILNGRVVEVLNSQSRGSGFKVTGWLHGQLSLPQGSYRSGKSGKKW